MKMNIGSSKLLCMTVGEELTRVVEMEKNAKAPRIHRAFSFPTPEGTVKDGYVSANEAFLTAFRKICREKGVTASNVAFTMDSGKIVSRDIVIPQIPEKKISVMLASNASDYFPIDISQYKLVYQILDKAMGEGGHRMRLAVYAVPYDLIRSYMRFARALNLEVASLDCLGNSTAQTIKIAEREGGKETNAHHVNLYLSLAEGSTVMTFRRGGVTELQRAVNFSFSETLAAIRSLLEMNGDYQVENIADEIAGRELLCASLDEVKRNRNESIDEKSVITEAIRPLIGMLKRNLDYFFEQQGDAELSVSAHLTDLGAEFVGLAALLSAELEIEVEVALFPNEKKYLLPGSAPAGSPIAAYASVIGGALAPLPLAEKVKQDTVQLPVFLSAGSVQRSVMALCGVVCAVCIGISICLAFLPAGQNAALKDKSDKLASQIASLGNPKQYYDLYQRALALAKEVKGLEYAMDTNNNHLVSFLEEMEQKMPKSFKAASFTVSETGVNMSVQVGSKQEAIFVLQTLRSMQSVKINSISGITETTVSGGGLSGGGGLLPFASAEPQAQDDEIDVQAYLDLALAMGKITKEEYDAYCKGDCTPEELAKLKSFLDAGTITKEQYDAILAFIEEKKNGEDLMSEADVVSCLQMLLMMNHITSEQYDRIITGKVTPEDQELFKEYYRTGLVSELEYKSILAFIESKKKGEDAGGTPVVSFTVSLTYTGLFEDGPVGKPAATTAPESTPAETDAK